MKTKKKINPLAPTREVLLCLADVVDITGNFVRPDGDTPEMEALKKALYNPRVSDWLGAIRPYRKDVTPLVQMTGGK